jgi:membrane fusion protein, multidrug efflux system
MTEETNQNRIPPQPEPASANRIWWKLILISICILLVCIVGYRIWASKAVKQAAGDKKQAGGMPVPVVTLAARSCALPVYLNGLGSVVPVNTVTVRSRVDGQLMEVFFKEGQEVAKGALLALIDPRPFQVQLSQAEGQLMRDKELLQNARLDLERYKTLWGQDSIPRQQLDTQQALVRQYEGTVKVDQGQIDSARLNLTYSRIVAPVAGRVGLRTVDPGNMVKAADTGGLVTITQQRPISVVFPLPEDSLPKVLARMRQGERLTVEAWDREMKQKLATGTLLTVDNQIDPATGTVKFKAAFSNSALELFPNQFINARLLLETKQDAIVIPSAAVQRGPQGAFIFQLKPDKTVMMKPVKPGITQGGETAILEGLAVGDLVVIEGAERLRDGSKVEPKEPARPDSGRSGHAGQVGGKGAPR